MPSLLVPCPKSGNGIIWDRIVFHAGFRRKRTECGIDSVCGFPLKRDWNKQHNEEAASGLSIRVAVVAENSSDSSGIPDFQSSLVG